MKYFAKVFIITLLILSVLTGCVGCAPSDSEIMEYYNQVSTIPQNDGYAFVWSDKYVSADKTIDFKALVKDKLKEDGKSVDTDRIKLQRYEVNTVMFLCRYKQSKRWGGINNNNNYYAIGTVSLKDYSVSVKYFKCKYETSNSFGMSETHYVVYLKDENKKFGDKEYEQGYITVGINDGSVKESDEYPSEVGDTKMKYNNPTSYKENGIWYNVERSYVNAKNIEDSDYIHVPSPRDILAKSEEMKQIVDMLGGENYCSYIDTFFFTNGEDLFIGLIAESDWLPAPICLKFPVIFKCDTSLESFEYIGCVYRKVYSVYNDLEVRRL